MRHTHDNKDTEGAQPQTDDELSQLTNLSFPQPRILQNKNYARPVITKLVSHARRVQQSFARTPRWGVSDQRWFQA
jgi:hypothetical protein